MTIFTADVSHWDGPVDWAAARQAGISAMVAKATEGGGPGYRYRDPAFTDQFDRAVAADLPLVGAYHCLSGESVDHQIVFFRQVYGVGRTTPGAQWSMLDVEPFTELQRAHIAPTFGSVEAFCDRWWSLTHLPLGLYLPRWVWQEMGKPSLTGLAGTPVLVSSTYPDATARPLRDLYVHAGGDTGPGWAPYGGLTPTLWQFGSSALIPGVRGGTGLADINAFRGSLADLIGIVAPTATPAPTPQPQEDPVVKDWITVKRGSTATAFIKNAQGLLLAHGLPIGSRDGLPDGSFGPVTETSTRALQSRYGITVDGQFGPHTLSVALVGRDLVK